MTNHPPCRRRHLICAHTQGYPRFYSTWKMIWCVVSRVVPWLHAITSNPIPTTSSIYIPLPPPRLQYNSGTKSHFHLHLILSSRAYPTYHASLHCPPPRPCPRVCRVHGFEAKTNLLSRTLPHHSHRSGHWTNAVVCCLVHR